MSYFDAIRASDSPSIDAFGRWRTSEPFTIFDSKQLHDAQPLLWDDAEVSGSGTTSSHDANTASTTIGVGATTAGNRTRQTFMRFNYQPGKSQTILMTGVLDKSGGGTGITRSWGSYDDDNGIFLKDDEGTYKIVRRTSTSGSAVDNEVAQSSWNVDTMDGDGPSGVTLDFTKTQIVIIDLEWLGVGRVRVGFVVDGLIYYAHNFNNANSLSLVYMSTPNLPLRYEIENDGTGAASTLEHICSTVISEGGIEDTGLLRSKTTENSAINAANNGTTYAVVGIRLKTTHLDAAINLVSMSMMDDEAGNFYEWQIQFNPTISGTFTYGDVTNSAVQAATGATATVSSDGEIVSQGFAVSKDSNIAPFQQLPNARRIGAAIDGTRDELVLCVTPLAGSSSLDIHGSLTWRELL